MKQTIDIVLSLSSGVVYWSSRRAGHKILRLEQFEPGHVRVGSQNHSRIIRLSYHHTSTYVTHQFGLKLPPLPQNRSPTWPYLEDFSPDHLPVWIWLDEPGYYGFPVYVAMAVGPEHAFRFASLIGKILSELAIDGAIEDDIEPLKINRPALMAGQKL
jgi:hypothetical protein